MHAFTFVSLVGLVAAQSTFLNFTLDKSKVDSLELSSWCTGERNTCQALCPGRPDANSCDIATLTYECTCQNGTEPGLKYYDQSLYSFICRESFGQCNENNAGDKAELTKCETDIRDVCGTLTIEDKEPTATSGGDTPDQTEGSDAGTTTGASDSESTDQPGAAPAMFPGKGAVVVAIGLAAALL